MLAGSIKKTLYRVFNRTGIFWNIDDERIACGKAYVMGWAFGQKVRMTSPQTVTIEVRDTDGNMIEFSKRDMLRTDVNRKYFSTDCDNFKSGFEIGWKMEDGVGYQIFFLMGNHKKRYLVEPRHLQFMDREHERHYDGLIDMLKNGGRELREDSWYCIRTDGIREYLRVLKCRIAPIDPPYAAYQASHRLSSKALETQRSHSFSYEPLISICIPLYNTPIPFLKALLNSVQAQTYGRWELCLADGSTEDNVETFVREKFSGEHRIQYRRLKENRGIAGNTNEAIQMANGDFVMLVDHDDTLEPNALYEMVLALNGDNPPDIIYTDEDLMDEGGKQYMYPRFKPDFNLEFLRSINYICHIFMVRKTVLNRVGAFREGYDGAQDYDLILRCCEQTQKIYHVPKVLYHWRAHQNSTAGNPECKMYAVDAAKRALEEHYVRVGVDAQVEYTGIFIMFRTILAVKGTPKVSLLIPNKDHIRDLDKCIRSVLEKTTYQNYEIIVIENNSEEEETFAYYQEIQQDYDNIKVVTWEQEFNYSKINNFGARFAEGDYLLLLNNDTEVISPTWISEMLGYCQREDVGAVGAKLFYGDDTVQHCGIVIGVGGFAGQILTGMSPEENGYFGRLKAIQEISAATAACLMVKRSIFEEIGGFDEEFAVALNDVDLCLRIRETGKRIILNPWVQLYHYESKSRGYEDSPEKIARFKREIQRFRERWQEILKQGDPYYNVNLTLDRGDCSVRRPDERFEIVEEIEQENK